MARGARQEDSSDGGGGGGGVGGSDGGGGGGGSDGSGLRPEMRVEIGVTRMQVRAPHIHWQQFFGANKSDASSECPNIWVPMFGIQTEFYLCCR